MMKAFIFDMDGVLIDSEPLHSRTKMETFRHYGLSFDAHRLEDYMGRTSRVLFQHVLRQNAREDLSAEDLVDYKHALYLDLLQKDPKIQPVVGVTKLLAELEQQRILLGVASSAGRVVIDAVLKKFCWQDVFHSVLSGTELPKSKPDPAVYLLSAQRLGVKPADCVVLEDAASGVAAAKAAGMYCIAYRNPHSGLQDLSKADQIVQTIADISGEALVENRVFR